MLDMGQYEYIRTAYRVYGKKIREIARDTGHSRNTVRRVLKGKVPEYKVRFRQAYPVLGKYREVIDEWLSGDIESPVKQRHTARRVYNRLVEERGFTGSESNVRRYVREAKFRIGLSGREAFIPLDPECAREAEVDWGGALAIIGGKRMVVRLFCMRSRYSGKDFIQAYPCERQEAFFDGHIQGFSYFGGVFRKIVYDNLKTAVLKVLKGKGRIEQDNFIKFRSYYTFDAIFCNLAKGNEKGGVEGLVGFARRNYLVPLPEVENFEELNEMLLKRCMARGSHKISGRTKTIDELFDEEKTRLYPLPFDPYPNIKILSSRVSHYSTVTIDHNRYSVPAQYVGCKVDVELALSAVSILYGGRRIAYHKRSYGKDKWILDPFHYLELLEEKPGAFDSARPIRQWRVHWPDELERLLDRFMNVHGDSRGIREFITILMLYKGHEEDEVNKVVKQGLDIGLSDAASIRTLLACGEDSSVCHKELVPAEMPFRLRDVDVICTDAALYNQLIPGVGVSNGS